jgi:hypothetical protein
MSGNGTFVRMLGKGTFVRICPETVHVRICWGTVYLLECRGMVCLLGYVTSIHQYVAEQQNRLMLSTNNGIKPVS